MLRRRGLGPKDLRDIKEKIYEGNETKTQKAVDTAKHLKRFIVDELFPDDEEETRWWVFNSAEVHIDDIQENEDGVEVNANIRPEDAMEMGGCNGLFSLPPVGEMSPEAAKDFHAHLQGWSKEKAKPPSKKEETEATEIVADTTMQQLHEMIQTADKHASFMSKVIRTCKTDEDAAETVRKCTEQLDDLEYLLGQMRAAEKDAEEKSSEIAQPFVDWAKELLNPHSRWVEKNKKICQYRMNAVVPEQVKAAKKEKTRRATQKS